MNHTLACIFNLAKPSMKYCTVFLSATQGRHLRSAIHRRDLSNACQAKQHIRMRPLLMHVRAMSSQPPGDALIEVNEWKGSSVQVVKDIPVKYEEGNWREEMQWVRSRENESVLLPPKDVSNIDVLAPELKPTFNLAAYINKSATLQQLLSLGVNLSSWDKRNGVSSFILPLDFERDMKPYIMFLHDKGVPADDLGQWITVNPFIFKEKIENLEARVSYLEYMKFNGEQIARVISKNPYWLLFSTIRLDKRLGFFQQSFELSDDEVRHLATRQPRLITSSIERVKRVTFSVLEEMGFDKSEVKSLLLAKPKIWMARNESLIRRFDFAHNHMGLSHKTLLEFPRVLLTRDFKLKQRHGFLKLLGRDQYDPTKANYVSPTALVSGTDAEFCVTLAKSSVQAFNDFLKTM